MLFSLHSDNYHSVGHIWKQSGKLLPSSSFFPSNDGQHWVLCKAKCTVCSQKFSVQRPAMVSKYPTYLLRVIRTKYKLGSLKRVLCFSNNNTHFIKNCTGAACLFCVLECNMHLCQLWHLGTFYTLILRVRSPWWYPHLKFLCKQTLQYRC